MYYYFQNKHKKVGQWDRNLESLVYQRFALSHFSKTILGQTWDNGTFLFFDITSNGVIITCCPDLAGSYCGLIAEFP